MLVKINYQNEEEQGSYILEISVTTLKDKKRTLEIISEFCNNKSNRFYTGPHWLIKHLKAFNIEAHELVCDEEFYL